MTNLYTYIKYRLSDKDKKYLIELDKEFGEVMNMFRNDRNYNDIVNIEDECSKFIDARRKGEKYIPMFKMHPNKFSENHILERMLALKSKFVRFNCFLSKYYIQNLDYFLNKVEFTLKKNENLPDITFFDNQPPKYLYDLAIKTVKDNPYVVIDEEKERPLDSKYCKEKLQEALDKLGYPWKVIITDKMLPRVGVKENKEVLVRTDAVFSEEDIDGLIQHELKGHVGRRYYGLKTGLYLFLYGLYNRNYLDEGLAVWNSLNLVKKIKPNVLYNIAMKYIVVYNVNNLHFNELFDLCRSISKEIPDDKLFKIIARAKRDIQDMSLLGGWADNASYFTGYQIIKKMTDKERDDILKWNIGPDQIKDLPEIKKFFKVNKFKPLI